MGNRIIKFRAWDIESSEMIYSENVKSCYDFYFQFDNGNLFLWLPQEEDFAEKRNAHIMQFTGLTDKNGKEIYENDLVEFEGFSAVEIKYKQGSFGYDSQRQFDEFIELSQSNLSITEVIGNIHENPELLK